MIEERVAVVFPERWLAKTRAPSSPNAAMPEPAEFTSIGDRNRDIC